MLLWPELTRLLVCETLSFSRCSEQYCKDEYAHRCKDLYDDCAGKVVHLFSLIPDLRISSFTICLRSGGCLRSSLSRSVFAETLIGLRNTWSATFCPPEI